jgi:hypothetical protein
VKWQTAALLLITSLIWLGFAINHALTTPWHPTKQMIDAKVKPLKQAARPFGAITWRA